MIELELIFFRLLLIIAAGTDCLFRTPVFSSSNFDLKNLLGIDISNYCFSLSVPLCEADLRRQMIVSTIDLAGALVMNGGASNVAVLSVFCLMFGISLSVLTGTLIKLLRDALHLAFDEKLRESRMSRRMNFMNEDFGMVSFEAIINDAGSLLATRAMNFTFALLFEMAVSLVLAVAFLLSGE